MVEVTGLEPAASWSQTKHSTKLSYTSLLLKSALLLYLRISELSTGFSKKFYKNLKTSPTDFQLVGDGNIHFLLDGNLMIGNGFGGSPVTNKIFRMLHR